MLQIPKTKRNCALQSSLFVSPQSGLNIFGNFISPVFNEFNPFLQNGSFSTGSTLASDNPSCEELLLAKCTKLDEQMQKDFKVLTHLLAKSELWVLNYKEIRDLIEKYHIFSAEYARKRGIPMDKNEEQYTIAIISMRENETTN